MCVFPGYPGVTADSTIGYAGSVGRAVQLWMLVAAVVILARWRDIIEPLTWASQLQAPAQIGLTLMGRHTI